MSQPLKLWTNGQDHAIAETPAQALEMTAIVNSGSVEDYEDVDLEWCEWPADKPMKLVSDDTDDGSDDVELELPEYFIAKYGKGHLASKNF